MSLKYIKELTKQNVPFFLDLFGPHAYLDDFGHSPEWNQEMEHWLSYVKSINPTWYELNKSRVNSEKQRDELLGEYKSLYYFGKIKGLKITEFEPSGNAGKKNDFAFNDQGSEVWHTEVKSPSWRGEVSKKIDNLYLEKLKATLVITESWPECKAEISCPNCSQVLEIKLSSFEFTTEEAYEIIKKTICAHCKKNIWHFSETERAKLKRDRLSKPQFINGEGGSYSDREAVEDAVKKSVSQFSQGKNNLLVITHNMFAGMGTGLYTSMDGGTSVKKTVQKYDLNNLISCVCLLDVQLDQNGIKFIPVFVPITKEPLIDNV
jgi:hypothetical protein